MIQEISMQNSVGRHTTLRIIAFSLILQASFSLISLASYLVAYRGAWASVMAAYPVGQRWGWLVASMGSVAAWIAGIAILRGYGWGRRLYVCAAFVPMAAYFVLLPWTLALSMVLVALPTVAILFSRVGTRYLTQAGRGGNGWPIRQKFAVAVFVFGTVLFYVTHVGMFLRPAWSEIFFARLAPMYDFALVLVLFAAAMLLSGKGDRAWRCAVALMVFVVATGSMLIGYVPYAPAFASYLGPAYRSYSIPWNLVLALPVLSGVVALTMLQSTKLMRRSRTYP